MDTSGSEPAGSAEITPEQVAELAALAHLEISPAELASLRRDLDRILAYVEIVLRIESDAAAHRAPVAAHGRPRDDRPASRSPTDPLLGEAPARRGDYFSVPPVMPPDPQEAAGD